MKKSLTFLTFLSLGLAGTLITGAAESDSRPIDQRRMFDLDYRMENSIDLTETTWRIRRGDDPAWAKPEAAGERGWSPVKVGMGLAAQGHPPAGFYWYRVRFDVPADWESDRDFLLDLGRISVFDQVYLNGEEVGHFSNLPPAEPSHGASGVRRRYLVAPSLVRFGETNDLAIRVRVGSGGGMYDGPYRFSSLANEVSVNFALKARPNTADNAFNRDAFLHYLTPSVHLNEFLYGNPIRLHPEIAGLNQAKHGAEYELRLRVRDEAGETVFESAESFALAYRRFISPLLTLDVPAEGEFVCEVALVGANGDAVWSAELPFTRKQRPARITLPVDRELRDLQVSFNQTHRIHHDSVGHYGGRRVDAHGELDPAVREDDIRGSLTFTSLVSPDYPDILLYQTNVHAAPKSSPRTPQGNRYDGYNDLWPIGYVSIGQSAAPRTIDVDANWSQRHYTLRYPDGASLEFTNSSLSPAFRLRTDEPEIHLFSKLSEWGIGQPSHLAFATTGGVRIRDAAEGLNGNEMSENWILVWFNGSENWDSFDMPWLFVIQQRPENVAAGEDSLRFRFGGPAGHLFGMPLFGVRLPFPGETADWQRRLPTDIVRSTSFWSRSLLHFPEFVERDFAVDFENNALTVEDRIRFSRISDAWGTSPTTDAPLSPTLVMSAISGNLDIDFDRPIIDPALPTLHGPLVLAHRSDSVRFQVRDLLHYMRQKRIVTDLDEEDPSFQNARDYLEKAVRAAIAAEPLDLHPWRRSIRGRGVVAGYAADATSHFTLALPFLSEELQEKLSNILLNELRENFLLAGVPDSDVAQRLPEAFRNEPVITKVVDPLNGLEMAMNARDARRGGLDGVVMESFRLHAIWQIADALDAWDEVEQNWPLIRQIFNLLPHSHDWAINQSWDFFTGTRIGNGLQESGVFYAGLLGVGRMARHLNEPELEEYAAYLATMQLVSLNAAATGIHYVRRHRPWSAANSEATGRVGLEDVELAMRERYVEFNEFAGSSQLIINARDDVQNPYSYLLWGLPVTKRPYQDLWPEANQYFFDAPRTLGSIRRPLLNIVAYVRHASTEEVRQEFEESLLPAYRTSPYLGYTNHHPDVVNIRVFLESFGTVEWKETR